MPKYLIFLLIGLITYNVEAQREKYKDRNLISGEVKVSRNNDASEINVFNLKTGQYTFTDEFGRFKIYAKKGDELVFSSILYQQFTVVVNESVLEKNELKISLREGATQLEEVIVTPGLSGYVQLDVEKLRTQKADISDLDVRMALYGEEYEFRPDRFSVPNHEVMDKGYLQDGINFANIFRSVFDIRSQPDFEERKLDVQVRKVRDDDFFKKYLDIEPEELNQFIDYLETKGLTYRKLRRNNDLQLIEFLIDEGRNFKNEQN